MDSGFTSGAQVVSQSTDSGHTSYIGSVLGVAHTLESYGLDAREILAEVGIDIDATPGFNERVPTDILSTAIANAAKDKLDPLFGLKYAEHVHPTTYHAFGVMLISSTTLRAFCQRLERYYAYVNTGDKVALEEIEEISRLRYYHPPYAINAQQILLHSSGWAATWLKLIRMLYKPDFAPVKVSFACARPEGYEKDFTEHFHCPVEFDAHINAIWFEAEDMDRSLPGGNAELARHSERLVYEYLLAMGQVDFDNRVRMTLLELLPRGTFSVAQLAEKMSLQEEELLRELKLHGTSYQQLLVDTRRELAEEYILRADLSVNEIAYTLGFTDCSNFARSFKRWMGQSPTEYRQDLHIGD